MDKAVKSLVEEVLFGDVGHTRACNPVRILIKYIKQKPEPGLDCQVFVYVCSKPTILKCCLTWM